MSQENDEDEKAAFRAVVRQLGATRARQLVWDEELRALTKQRAATPPPTRAQLLGMDVRRLEVSTRAENCFANAGIETIAELIHWQPSELLRVKNLGRGTLREIVDVLACVGLSLRPDGAHLPLLLPPDVNGYSVLLHGDLVDYGALRAAGITEIPERAALRIVENRLVRGRPVNDRRR